MEQESRSPLHVTFWAVAGVVCAAFAILIVRQLTYGLEYDESYLLRVASNVAAGAGFVDDGMSFYTTGRPFDPNISTGPTVLVPVAAVWALTDGSIALIRLVPLLYFALLLAATAWLLARYGGRWAALAAVSGYLLIPQVHPDLQNGSLMPGRVVGELPATALLMLAAALVASRRPGLAGLAAGMAIEAKLVFAIPAVALLVISAIWTWRSDRPCFASTTIRFMVGAAIPVLAFEIFKLAVLGTAGYALHLNDTQAFGTSQSLPLASVASVLPSKLAVLQSLISPAMVVVAVLLGVVVGSVRGRRVADRPDRVGTPWPCQAAIMSLTVGFALMIGWWLLRSQQLSPRPVLPAIAVLTSLMCGVTVTFAHRLLREERRSVLARTLVAGSWTALTIGVAVSTVGMLTDQSGATLRMDQLAAARVLADHTEVVARDGFWTNPELQLLSDLPPAEHDPSGVIAYTSVRALIESGTTDARDYVDRCATVLFSSRNVVVCVRR